MCVCVCVCSCIAINNSMDQLECVHSSICMHSIPCAVCSAGPADKYMCGPADSFLVMLFKCMQFFVTSSLN